MLTEALKYLISLAEPKVITVNGDRFATSSLHPVVHKEPMTLVVHTLTGLVDYIKEVGGAVGDDSSQPIVHVDDFNMVSFRSELQSEHSQRYTFIRSDAVPMFGEARELIGRPVKEMIVRLGTCFAPNDDREKLIRLIGNIADSTAVKTTDDGITKQVNVKQGISLQGVADMPNTVDLLPWRSFPEIVPQPSKWLVRVDRGERDSGPVVSLFEVNREQWRAATIAAISAWLKEKLGETCIIIA